MGDITQRKSKLDDLRSQSFDLLVAGAGIFGACAAWEAALRGYNVALVEQNDFGSGVSANSFKIVHGGIRYIQHLDVPRVRSSCRERSTFLRIAPHLVKPLPIVIPTYGLGMSGKPILATGTWLYDLLTADRNRAIRDAERQIPWAKTLSRSDVLDLFPGLDASGLTGAVQFSDGQIYNPPRFVLAFLQSAADRGAVIANYTKVTGFRINGDSVKSVTVRDELTDESFEIRAKTFLNAAGPWTDNLLNEDKALQGSTPGVYSRDACFVVPRLFDHDRSVAIMGQTTDPDAVMSRPARHLFVVPWREHSLVGTWHKVVPPEPDATGISREEIASYIDEVHAAYPDIGLSPDDVRMCNWGLVPFGEEQSSNKNLSYGKRSILVDHAKNGGPDNLVSLVGIRLTMGHGDARWAMKRIAAKLGDRQSSPPTHEIPIFGGEFETFDSLCRNVREQANENLPENIVQSLAHNHGSNAGRLLNASDSGDYRTIGNSHVLESEVVNAVSNEMAMTLADVVFRRTDLASGGSPGDAELEQCADVVAALSGWSPDETARQLESVRKRIPGW